MGGGQAPGCLPGPRTGWPRSGAARAEDRCGGRGQGAQSQSQGELRAVVGGGAGGTDLSGAALGLPAPPEASWELLGDPRFRIAHTALLPGARAPGQERAVLQVSICPCVLEGSFKGNLAKSH